MSNNHKLAAVGQIHKIHNWEFADSATRTAFVYLDTDIGKVARQLDTNAYYLVQYVVAGVATFINLTAVGTDLSGLVAQATTDAFAADVIVLNDSKTYTDTALALKQNIILAGIIPSTGDVTDGDTVTQAFSKLQSAVAVKADEATTTTALAAKADITALDAYTTDLELAAALLLKADVTALTDGLALKADVTALTDGLALKADVTALTDGLALKASLLDLGAYTTTTDLNLSLSSKADVAALAGLATTQDLTDALLLKADVTALTDGLALKADVTALTDGLALKANTTALADYTLTTDLNLALGAKQDTATLPAAVIATPLVGVAASSGNVTEGDTVLSAINKLQSAVTAAAGSGSAKAYFFEILGFQTSTDPNVPSWTVNAQTAGSTVTFNTTISEFTLPAGTWLVSLTGTAGSFTNPPFPSGNGSVTLNFIDGTETFSYNSGASTFKSFKSHYIESLATPSTKGISVTVGAAIVDQAAVTLKLVFQKVA